MRIVFDKQGAFEALTAARAWCRKHGISFGSSQDVWPTGLMRGDYRISKWGLLSRAEIAALDGTLSGDFREGPVVLELKELTAKPLFVPLRTEFFEAFEAGEKDTEYRPYGPRWNERTCPVGRLVTLSHGYGTKRRLQGVIVDFDRSAEPTRSAAWRACYGDRGGDAACIRIMLIVPAAVLGNRAPEAA